MVFWIGLLSVFAGCNLAGNNRSISSTKTEIQKDLTAALVSRHTELKDKQILVAVESIDGDYATGLSTNEDGLGGTKWLAYFDGINWVLVWDGNGVVDCGSLEDYDFPVDMVPKCLDNEKGELVDLTTTEEIISGQNENDFTRDEISRAMEEYLVDSELKELTVEQLEGDFAKGSVTLEGDAGGWFLAVRRFGMWEIIAMGSDVVDCERVEKYGFPTDMVTVCYDLDKDQTVVRVTVDDVNKIVSEVFAVLGYEVDKTSDTAFDWVEYGGGKNRVEAYGAEIVEIVSWEDVGRKLQEKYYFNENNTSTNLYGFFVRDNVVCQAYQYNDGGIYISCGVL